MDSARIAIPLVILLAVGCATISEKNRLAKFDGIGKSYERAITDSDFETAGAFVDGETVHEEVDFDRYKNIKVVDYKVKQSTISEDKMEIHQTVEIEYYQLDRLVVRSLRHKQLWKYNADTGAWLLQTPLPEFK
jgi:hypothetical protein